AISATAAVLAPPTARRTKVTVHIRVHRRIRITAHIPAPVTPCQVRVLATAVRASATLERAPGSATAHIYRIAKETPRVQAVSTADKNEARRRLINRSLAC